MKCPICKNSISDSTLKCPHCKTRIGLLCNNCNTINKLGTLVCKNCKTELLKLCKHCNSVNFPIATKCRKCGTLLDGYKPQKVNGINLKNTSAKYTISQSVKLLEKYIQEKEIKFISVTGPRGCGKTTLLNQIKQNTEQEYQWCVGQCSSYSQITAGGVLQSMLLNLFNLPQYYTNLSDLQKDAIKFFSNEFKFLNSDEISRFINFLYNHQDGNYEDIIINKKYTYNLLWKVFEAFVQTDKFIFVIDNFDLIDGFSLEFFTNFIQQDSIQEKIKLIALYNNPRPILHYFGADGFDLKSYIDINLASLSFEESEIILNMEGYSDTSMLEKDKYIISEISSGNPAFMEQAVFYCFDCQVANKSFDLPDKFSDLIKLRLEILQTGYPEAFKTLCAMTILGYVFNPLILNSVFNYEQDELREILSYLQESRFIKKYNDSYYEFQNRYLWETILINLRDYREFEEANVRVAKAVSVYSLNTDAILTAIAYNLKEHRMSFDIWTKISRLSAYIGDINLYVISQRQCLALLNEFNENETLNIRFNISERLGKILAEYDAESAVEFLPDAISNAKTLGNDTKELELLGYLAQCCKKTGNYYGDIECADNALKKLPENGYELEASLIKATKINSLLKIGNSGEVINLVDNDILPILNKQLTNPRLDKTIPLELIYETRLKAELCLAEALVMQGNKRVFEVLDNLSEILKKHNSSSFEFDSKYKLIKAFANTIKGDFSTSNQILKDLFSEYRSELENKDAFDNERSEIMNMYSLIDIVNKLMQKNYIGFQEELFTAVSFANDTDAIFTKHILKVFLGKMFYDNHQATNAIKIYNEEITYFAKEKFATGALLTWYLIAQAVLITDTSQKSMEIAQQALEIAQNPKINNYFFIVLIKMLIAKIYIELGDFESAKMNIETALSLAQKHEMNDLLSKLYLLYGKYYQELSSVQNEHQTKYQKKASTMLDMASNIVTTVTNNKSVEEQINIQKSNITFC